MSKKLLLSLAPLLAVAVFAMTSAAAQAQTTYGTCAVGAPHQSNCPSATTEHFTPFATGVKVKVLTKKVPGSGDFKLTSAALTIDCTSLKDHGFVVNEGSFLVGHSEETLEFDGCTVGGCNVETEPAGPGNITGVVTDEVLTATTVRVTIASGFEIGFSGTPTGCPAKTVIGDFTGSATGTQNVKTNILKFAATKGFKLEGAEMAITGEDEAETEAGLKVYI
jgi:hypothetical protein